MKTLFFALAVAPLIAFAQPPDVLIEACNTMQDVAKRLECLKAAMSTQVVPVKKDLVDPVRRAFGNMQSSLNVGISYNNYQIAILDLAKAVSAYKQDAGSEGASRARHFDEALEAYSDAGTFWERSISFYARGDNNLSYAGGLPVGLNGLDWLVSKYQLPTSRADLLGFHAGLPVNSTRSKLWEIAKTKTEAGFALQIDQKKNSESFMDALWLPYEFGNEESERSAVDKIGKGSDCTNTPFLGRTELSTTRGRQYTMRCNDGTTMNVLCAMAICRAIVLSIE